MRPLKLTLQGYGPFIEQQTIDFTKLKSWTPVLLCGPGGSGKAMVLNAMLFALFGDTKDKHLKCINAGLLTNCEVILEFLVNNERFLVRRWPNQEKQWKNRRRNVLSSAALLWSLSKVNDGKGKRELIAQGWNKVTQSIEQILGAQKIYYRDVIMFPQLDRSPFFQAEAREIEKILKDLFHVDNAKTVWHEILRTSNSYLQESNYRFSFTKIEENDIQHFFKLEIVDKIKRIRRNIESLSLGESSLVLVALHLGLFDVLHKHPGSAFAEIIFMDRVLDYLDTAMLKQLLRRINQQKKNYLIIFISSDPGLKNCFRNCIEIKESNNTKNTIHLTRCTKDGPQCPTTPK